MLKNRQFASVWQLLRNWPKSRGTGAVSPGESWGGAEFFQPALGVFWHFVRNTLLGFSPLTRHVAKTVESGRVRGANIGIEVIYECESPLTIGHVESGSPPTQSAGARAGESHERGRLFAANGWPAANLWHATNVMACGTACGGNMDLAFSVPIFKSTAEGRCWCETGGKAASRRACRSCT